MGKDQKIFSVCLGTSPGGSGLVYEGDDDTYVIVENLKSMLQDVDPNEPVYYGARFDMSELKEGYMSGGAGYVLSKEALRRFVEDGLPDPKKCEPRDEFPDAAEDMEMGISSIITLTLF